MATGPGTMFASLSVHPLAPFIPLSRDSCNVNAPLQQRRTTTTSIRDPIAFHRGQLDISANVGTARSGNFVFKRLSLLKRKMCCDFIYLL